MSWQVQDPRAPLGTAADAVGRLADSPGDQIAAARSREHAAPTGTMIEPQASHATRDPLCVIRPHGADLVLTGEIDLRNVEELESRLLAWVHDADNHLDLTGVDFVDSMGIVMLLRVYNSVKQRGANLHITCSTSVYDILSMAGLTGPLPGLTLAKADSDD